jgi:hypothetical protein
MENGDFGENAWQNGLCSHATWRIIFETAPSFNNLKGSRLHTHTHTLRAGVSWGWPCIVTNRLLHDIAPQIK